MSGRKIVLGSLAVAVLDYDALQRDSDVSHLCVTTRRLLRVLYDPSSLLLSPIPSPSPLLLQSSLTHSVMKYVALLSGGKDSCYNLSHCAKHGHELVAAASLGPEQGKGSAITKLPR